MTSKKIAFFFILIFSGCNPSTQEINEPLFAWDFSKSILYTYSFTQDVKGEDKSDLTLGYPQLSAFIGTGNLNVQANGNGLADLSITEMYVDRYSFDKNGNPADKVTEQLPESLVKGMSPDGTFGDYNKIILYEFLFPLPKKNIELGESIDIPMEMTFNTNRGKLLVKGQNRLTYIKTEPYKERDCAILKGEIDISEIDIPDDFTGSYSYSTSGKAIYYFDKENKYFVAADILMRSVVRVKDISDDPEIENSYMDLKSQNSYKYELKEIIE